MNLETRVIRPERLDEAGPREAAPSLRDLARINHFFGGRRVLLRRLVEVLPADGTLLDVGAASGDLARGIRERFPQAHVTCLDATWSHLQHAAGDRVAADAFHLPFEPDSFDVVTACLFLHHFEDRDVVRLLKGFRAVARKGVVIVDLNRRACAYYFLPATRWLFRWNEITLHDGPASVAAAFRREELEALAEAAGLREIRARSHHPWFRVSLVGTP